ncbi:MAG: hypothetical protein ACERKJ_10460, partial [Candidatus Dadabacteria bacterium]
MTTKRTPLKHDLRSLFSESTNDDRGLEFFITQSDIPNSISEKRSDLDKPSKNVDWDDVLKEIAKKSNPQV